MPRASPTLAGCAGRCAFALGFFASACVTTTPIVELGFGVGARVTRADETMREERPLVNASLGAGAVYWSLVERGERPPAHQGVGAVVTATAYDLDEARVGAELIYAPPRLARRTGFQLRGGLHGALDGEALATSLAAEWADVYLGALFAEASYDFIGDEAAFLVGARINLLFPYTTLRADVQLLD